MLLALLWIPIGLILAQAPDAILYNGRIFTSNPQQLRVAATVPKDQVLQTFVGPRVMDDRAATRFELDRFAPDHRVWIASRGTAGC